MEITHQDRLNRVRDRIVQTVHTAALDGRDPTDLLVIQVHEEMNKMAVVNDRLENQLDMMAELIEKERARVAGLEKENARLRGERDA
jgi:hypothetical protein